MTKRWSIWNVLPVGAISALVSQEIGHRLWWGKHPGSEVRFVWWLVGAVFLGVVFFVAFQMFRYYQDDTR